MTAAMTKKPAVMEKKPAGKKLPKAHAIQLEIQSAEMIHDLAEEVAEILWERFQIECRWDALEDAELITHITDLSSLSSPHAGANRAGRDPARDRKAAGRLSPMVGLRNIAEPGSKAPAP